MKITITGAVEECECGICGRALKLGVQTDSLGIIGADCFIAAIKPKRDFRGKTWKPSQLSVKESARWANASADAQIRAGRYPETFQYELA